MLGRGGAAPWERCGCPPTPPLYIGARERGPGPLRSHLVGGAAARGRWLAPQARGGAPPFRVSPNPRRMGPRGVGSQPTKGWFPSTYSP